VAAPPTPEQTPRAAALPKPTNPAAVDPIPMPRPLPQAVTRSIVALTSDHGPDRGLAPAEPRRRPTPPVDRTLLSLITMSRPVAEGAPPRERARLSELVGKVKRHLAGQKGARVEVRRDSVLVRLEEAITFDQGRAELKPAMRGPLHRLAGLLSNRAGTRVVVTGHTDNLPISTPEFPSNWELSAARAATVARALMAQGAEAGRFTIRGLADQRPLAPNTTPLGRQENRRVEIELWPHNQG